MHTTTLPTFLPLCSSRKAASHPRARSKVWVGSPCSTPAAARRERRWSTRCIHGGSCCMSLSIASTSYRTAARACHVRVALHTPRLPISSKAPPSPSSAVDAEMKSSDKLLSTTAKRPPQSVRAAPRANAAPPRDELSEIALGPPRTAPSSRMDDATEPLGVLDRHQTHAARRGVDQRRLPAAQLRTAQRDVHRAPRDRQRARRLEGERDRLGCEPRGGAARNARETGDAEPEYSCAGAKVSGAATGLQDDTRAIAPGRAGVARSRRVGRRVERDGDPASQYLQPVVGASATSSSISESPSGAPKSGWASSFKLAIAPRDGSRSCKRSWRANGSGARRGTCARSGATYRATSGSATPAHALSARSAARGSAACRTGRRSNGASCRTQRARPSRPACGAGRGASALCMAERSTSRAPGAVAMRVITHSAACSIGSGSRPRRDAARRTSTPSVPPTSTGAADGGSTDVAVVVTGSAPSSNTDEALSLPAGPARLKVAARRTLGTSERCERGVKVAQVARTARRIWHGQVAPKLTVGRHVHRQNVVRSHCCRVERPPLVLQPPDCWVRAGIKPRTRAQMHVRSLLVRVLDTAKRLARPAAAPPLRKGAELAAVVVARAAIERVSRHVLRAARLHFCR
eukprot:scaffold22169_cov69-Phaeocystis_antarctica.AAC.2